MRVIYQTRFDGKHFEVERCDGKPIVSQWDVLYRIKNEIVGEDACLIEIYPSIDNLINDINRRHLFVIDPDALIKLGAWLCR